MTKSPQSIFPIPIIGGAPRSGTTLLRLMLDAHPLMAIPPETGWLTSRDLNKKCTVNRFIAWVTKQGKTGTPWDDLNLCERELRKNLKRDWLQRRKVDRLQTLYQCYAERFNKPRYGEKTPLNILHMQEIEAALPQAHFIHIIRDPRAVAASLKEQWFTPEDGFKGCIDLWEHTIRNARKGKAHCTHYLEVRYEDLITNTEQTLRQVCGFLDLPWSEEMLHYHHGAAARIGEHQGRPEISLSKTQRQAQQHSSTQPPMLEKIDEWTSILNSDEKAQALKQLGQLLEEFGYSS